MRKITSFFLSMVMAAALPTYAANPASDDQPNEDDVKGTWFDISANGQCTIPLPADTKYICTFAGQWGAITPSVADFDPETDEKVFIKFAEALTCNFNMPWKNSEDQQKWGFGIDCIGKTEVSIDVDQVIKGFSIQNVQPSDQPQPSFTITEGYVLKKSGEEVAIGPWTAGWNTSVTADAKIKSGQATIKGQWSGINVSNDIIGMDGPKKLRIYTNSDITDFPIQWCIKKADDTDAWPPVGKVNANYAETVIKDNIKSIYLQYTGQEPGTIDIKAITWEKLATYGVTVAEGIENGMVTVAASEGYEGENISFTVTPAEGYKVESVDLNVDNSVLPCIPAENGVYSFIMPAGDVTINATFAEDVIAPTSYVVSVAEDIENGTVTVDPAEAAEGETVTITATPADGYKLESVSVKNGEDDVEVAEDNTFTMPAGNVTVSATFVTAGDPVMPAEPAEVEIAAGDYVIYNVATGKYLGGANAWGTQASLLDHATIFTVAKLEDGTYTLDSHTYNNATNHFLGDGAYIDSPAAGFKFYCATGELSADKVVIALDKDNAFGAPAEGNIVATGLAWTDKNAEWELVSVDDLVSALEKDLYDDATFLLKNASISRNLYNAKFEKAWEGDEFAVGGANENMNAEKWGGNSEVFDVHQTISIPNGTYAVTAQGFYRYNNTTDNTNDVAIAAHADGTEKIYSFLYANDKEVALKSIADDEAAAALESLPFSQTDASAAFGKGLYNNKLEVEVTDGTLTIGIKKTQHIGTDWTIWDNFTITKIEKQPTPEIAATVENAALAVADDEAISEEDGTFKVTFTYNATVPETAQMASGELAYTVTAEGKEPITGTTDFDVDSESRNIYVKGLDYDTEYTLTVNSIKIADMDLETFESKDIYAKTYEDGELACTFKTNAKAEEPEENLVEIAQTDDTNLPSEGFTYRAQKTEGEGYTEYTFGGNICVAFKMLNVDVRGCDKIIIKFAEPTPANLKASFAAADSQDNFDVEEGTTELVMDLTDSRCNVVDGHIGQICLLTIFGADGTKAKVAGVYKHVVDTSVDGIDAVKAANGKYMENGKIVIVKNGKKISVAGFGIK